MKRTKIIATLSDRRCDREFIRSLYRAGMNAVRINSAHATEEGARRIVDNVRAVADDIAVILDTKGPEIRLTGMEEATAATGIPLRTGERITLRGTGDDRPCTREELWVNYPYFVRDVPVGASVLIDDGEIGLRVEEKTDDALRCTVQNDGVLWPHKSVNVPGVEIDLPSLTEKDRRFIEWGIEAGVDFIAHSFVRTRADVEAVRALLDERGSDVKIISKIENQQGVDHIDEILEATYGVMVARGDLGVELAAEEIPIMQRMIVERAIAAKRPVIIATQMLHTMIQSPRPTRAEVSDIAGAIYQRVDAVMLSGETASGAYPVQAVETMARVAETVEHDTAHFSPLLDINMVAVNREITAQLARSAVRTSVNLPIRAIIIDTLSGRTGRYMAAFRGQKPVYAVCYRQSVQRQLAISYGIRTLYRDQSADRSELLVDTLDLLEQAGEVAPQDLIVVVGGEFKAANGASFLEIGTAEQLHHSRIMHKSGQI